ncbi:High-affinity branched-chain amino acid transport system permease protein LivH [Bordetella tumbae]|uniref:branched-chain amino acid ABC transporter permease n=1 Tax=Bordetella tumbae TaxID=1649139 RepID=UPI0039F12650
MTLYLLQIFNGIGVGMLYFLMAVGLSIIFGLLRFVNFAHGAFFMIGAYLAYAIVVSLGLDFWVSLIVVPIVVFVFAIALERVLLRHAYRLSHMAQILLTFGLSMILQELAIVLWGTDALHMPTPQALGGIVEFGSFIYPTYRLFVIAFTAVLALVLWWLLEGTRLGAIVRAGSEHGDMTSLLGHDIPKIFMLVFGLGVALAALAGVLAAPIRGVEPFMGLDGLSIAFVVVVIGGMGSFSGALVGGLLVGVLQSLLSSIWPEMARPVIYVCMAMVLLMRPYGLFGRG